MGYLILVIGGVVAAVMLKDGVPSVVALGSISIAIVVMGVLLILDVRERHQLRKEANYREFSEFYARACIQREEARGAGERA